MNESAPSTLQCPYCETRAKTARGLVKHLTGTTPYGGHEVERERAKAIVADIASEALMAEVQADDPAIPALDLPNDVEELFLAKLLREMVNSKALPKVQFERIIGPFIGLFLPQILNWRFGGEFQVVALEFPLMKPGSKQSTNVDYLVYGVDELGLHWWLVELKTDRRSIGDKQIDKYELLVGSPIEKLIEDVRTIRSGSSRKEKYDELLRRFDGIPTDGRVGVLYLAPSSHALETRLKEKSIEFVSFSELVDTIFSEHSGEWHIFQKVVLPALA